ncbi:MAG: GNAT family protein [Rothia sp. (in: high G+C Gram-positive bacteria)]|nr:GNAT family protein [Rothia sp. (in: high G+C Gram-positive bacteria)]
MFPTLANKPTLTGSLVELRPFNSQAVEAMLEILQEPEVLIKTGTVHTRDPQTHQFDRQKTLDWYAQINQQTDRLDLAIYSQELDRYVGEVVLNDYDPANKSVNFRIAIGQAGQNRGYGTQATLLLVNYAFEQLDINRIELEVLDFNQRAKHVYTSCGFVAEGRRRQAFLIDGEYHDAVIKSVIRSDWEAARSVAGHLTLDLKRVEI